MVVLRQLLDDNKIVKISECIPVHFLDEELQNLPLWVIKSIGLELVEEKNNLMHSINLTVFAVSYLTNIAMLKDLPIYNK